MEKAVIVYGSVTGLAEEIACTLNKVIEDKYDTKVIDAMDAGPQDLQEADIILLGSSTWGVGDLEVDMVPLNDSLQDMDLKSKRAAVFGLGDSAYKKFCYAVITLEKSLKSAGAQLIQKGYRCDKYFDDEAKSKLKEWATAL